MSEWPQLEQRLVDSAERRQRRRWVRPAVVLVPVAAALAVAALVLGTSGGIPDDERAIEPQTTGLARVYGAFREPATEEDVPPYSAEQREQIARDCEATVGLCLRPDTARRVRDGDGTRVYLMQGRTGDQVCAVTFAGDRYTAADCTRAGATMSSYGDASGYTVFPDGVSHVAWTLNDGSVVTGTVERNVAWLTAGAAVTSVNWKADGRYQSQVVPADEGRARCPDLEPLPAGPDAAAKATATDSTAALLELDEARLRAGTIRRATAADVAGCGAAVAERTLVVDVTLDGRLAAEVLIGFRDGNAVMWSRLT